MSSYRHRKRSFKPTSRKAQTTLRLKTVISGNEFEAEGPENTVVQQYEKFIELTKSHQLTTCRIAEPPISSSPRSVTALPDLEQFFQNAHQSSVLTLTIPLPEDCKDGSTILFLLWGYKQLRAAPEVSVLELNKSLACSQWIVPRLDRILKYYLKNQFIVKLGRGKGGKYRLTQLGEHKAKERMLDLTRLLPLTK